MDSTMMDWDVISKKFTKWFNPLMTYYNSHQPSIINLA